MAAWQLTCENCDQKLNKFDIENTLESYFFPARPDLLKGGKEFECPNCGHKAMYHQTDVTYAP